MLRALKVMVDSNVALASGETAKLPEIVRAGAITAEEAAGNVEFLRSQAESWLAVLFNVFSSVGRDSQGMVGDVVSAWAAIAGEQVRPCVEVAVEGGSEVLCSCRKSRRLMSSSSSYSSRISASFLHKKPRMARRMLRTSLPSRKICLSSFSRTCHLWMRPGCSTFVSLARCWRAKTTACRNAGTRFLRSWWRDRKRPSMLRSYCSVWRRTPTV